MSKRKIANRKSAEGKSAEGKLAKRNSAAFVIATASLIFCATAHAQIGHPPASPSMNGAHELHITDREMPTPLRQIDPVRLQKDALALATAASSIPADIETVRKGILPKEIILKLKQIEKLSKQLRNELNP